MVVIQAFDSIYFNSLKLFKNSIPVGGIIIWTNPSIPSGWAICDGTNGTPDLRGRFIVGHTLADASFNTIGYTAGTKQVTLTTSEIPSHSHSLPDNIWYTTGSNKVDTGGSTKYGDTITTSSTLSTGGGGAHNNLPPYYVVYYIKRIY